MTALDDLLDARVSHAEIAEHLGISTQAVRLRYIQREREALQAAREGWAGRPREGWAGRLVAVPVRDAAVAPRRGSPGQGARAARRAA